MRQPQDAAFGGPHEEDPIQTEAAGVPHSVPGQDMGGLVAHDCCNLILGLQQLQQACVEHHLASRRHKGIHIARLIDDRKLPLQVLCKR